MGGGINFTPDLVRNLPIPLVEGHHASVLSKSSTEMHELTFLLHTKSNRFETLIKSEFGVERFPKTLSRWWLLDFTDFIKVLKAKLSLQQKDELLQLFEHYRTDLSTIDSQIETTDRRINQTVQELYSLTSDEIKIIEGAL